MSYPFSATDESTTLEQFLSQLAKNYPKSLDKQTLFRLALNDPRIARLHLHADTWIEGADSAIANSKALQHLGFSIYDSDDDKVDWLKKMCNGLARNRSVEELRVVSDGCEIDLDIFKILTPFIEYNRNLRSIDLKGVTSEVLKSLSIRLAVGKPKQLQCVDLRDIVLEDHELGLFFYALKEMKNLQELSVFESEDDLYRRRIISCRELARLLVQPRSKIRKLLFGIQRLTDNNFTFLSNAVIRNNSLCELHFYGLGEYITEVGWRNFSRILSHPMCTLHTLRLDTCLSMFEDEFGGKFSSPRDILAVNKSLEYLDIRSEPTRSLETLEYYQSRSLDIEREEAMICLGNALAINKTLRYLDLESSSCLSLTAWRNFSKCLRSPHSSIEFLNLRYCNLDDYAAITLAMALIGNSRLKTMLLSGNDDITNATWDVFSQVLCRKRCIDSTYSSNHTLQEVGVFHYADADDSDITSLLSMNVNKDKAEVARQKIMKQHFPVVVTEEVDMLVFARMPEIVMLL